MSWEIEEDEENLFQEINEETGDTSSEETIKKALKGDVVVEEAEEDSADSSKNTPESEEDLFSSMESPLEDEEGEDESSDEEDEDEEEDEDNPSTKSVKNPAVAAANFLKSKGYLELEDGEKITEEDAEEFLEIGLEAALDKRLEERIADMPEDAKKLMKYLHNGGTITSYITELASTMGPSYDLTDEINLDDEEDQEAVMRSILAEETDDEDEIEAEIEMYKDSGKLKDKATRAYAKWKKEKEKKEAEMLQNQEKQRREIAEKIRERKAEIGTYLSDPEKLGGLQAPANKEKELPNYMFDKVEKLSNNTVVTRMQKALFYDIPANPVAHTQLAVLLQYRKADGTFDLEIFKKLAESEVTQKVQNNVRRNNTKDGKKKPVKKSARSLADLF